MLWQNKSAKLHQAFLWYGTFTYFFSTVSFVKKKLKHKRIEQL